MARFVCKGCNYRIDSDSDHTGKECPYCGEKTIIREQSAEELLKEE